MANPPHGGELKYGFPPPPLPRAVTADHSTEISLPEIYHDTLSFSPKLRPFLPLSSPKDSYVILNSF